MFASHVPARLQPEKVVPVDLYRSQVDALYADARSLLIGSIAATATALVTAVETGETMIYGVAVGLALLGCLRLFAMRVYARRRPGAESLAGVRRWERFYVAGASAHVGLLGLFCLATFALTEDPFARLASFAITLAYLVGIPGRSFASDLLVDAQTLCAAVPTFLALAVAGRLFWLISVLVMLPFFVALRTISTRLRGIFLEAILRARDLSLMATRFDTALNNMPHGLFMLGPDDHLDVSNRRLADLLGLSLEQVGKGASIEHVLRDCVDAGVIEPSQARDLAAALKGRRQLPSSDPIDLDLNDGRTLAFTIQAMEGGGSVVLAEDITERRNAETRISQLAHFDPLTGLPNRIAFRDRVAARLAADRSDGDEIALLFVDLDEFKQVNDTLGHAQGDKLLSAVAERLRCVLDDGDIAARFGGDEFVLMHAFRADREGPEVLAAYIIQQLSMPYEIEGLRIVTGASIGVALAKGSADVDLLLRNADMALYRAKAEGRGTCRLFEPDMEVRANARREIELDLRSALANGEFELNFQPIYSLRTKRFSVCEALLRWNHPKRGRVSPGEFIPVAEEMGLIVEIGDWVLRQACLACASWPSDVHVAVNISPVQFRHGHVLASVRGALEAAGLPPHRLEIEITESVLLQNLQLTRIMLHQLREHGVQISLDDFGTGYSSLSYLHVLELNKVKIDRSFLQGLGTSGRALTLLRAITRLSAELGILVVMEGVETPEQLALVSATANVDEIQGFLFSRPLPGDDLLRVLQSAASAAA